jgi:hypothetical protein
MENSNPPGQGLIPSHIRIWIIVNGRLPGDRPDDGPSFPAGGGKIKDPECFWHVLDG